jgi:hypothetical protein
MNQWSDVQAREIASACVCLQVRPGAACPKGDTPGAVALAAVAVACLLAATGLQQLNPHPTNMVQQQIRSVELQLLRQGATGEAGAGEAKCCLSTSQGLH